jgi:hypothetical protein
MRVLCVVRSFASLRLSLSVLSLLLILVASQKSPHYAVTALSTPFNTQNCYQQPLQRNPVLCSSTSCSSLLVHAIAFVESAAVAAVTVTTAAEPRRLLSLQ